MTIEDSSWIHPELNDIVNDIVWLSASRHFFPWVSAHQLANTSVKNVGRVQIINHSLVWWARLSFLGNYLRLNNIKIQPSLKLELLGQDVQIPIKLTQDKRNFELSFVTLQWGFSYCLAFCFEFDQNTQNKSSEKHLYTRKIYCKEKKANSGYKHFK